MKIDIEWISIKERLPSQEECERYCGWFLVVRSFVPGRPFISRYDGYNEERNYDHGWKYSIDETITHWMPLPELPDV